MSSPSFEDNEKIFKLLESIKDNNVYETPSITNNIEMHNTITKLPSESVGNLNTLKTKRKNKANSKIMKRSNL
jgi:hypothetical protein